MIPSTCRLDHATGNHRNNYSKGFFYLDSASKKRSYILLNCPRTDCYLCGLSSSGWSVVSPTEVPKCAKLCKKQQAPIPTKNTRPDLREQLDTLTSTKNWNSTFPNLGSTTIQPSFPHPRTESNWATLVQLMEVHFCHVASCRIRIRDANLAGKLPLVLRILDSLPKQLRENSTGGSGESRNCWWISLKAQPVQSGTIFNATPMLAEQPRGFNWYIHDMMRACIFNAILAERCRPFIYCPHLHITLAMLMTIVYTHPSIEDLQWSGVEAISTPGQWPSGPDECPLQCMNLVAGS